MAEDKRLTYSKKWFQKGVKSKDPFDKFIYFWISLVIAAQYNHASRGTDREKILDFFRSKRALIYNIIKKHHQIMFKLAKRRGTEHAHPIVDTGNQKLRRKLLRIVEFYTEGVHLNEDEIVEYVAELLSKIRNNLFHGGKVYDDKEDIALLDLVNPIMHDVLGVCLY